MVKDNLDSPITRTTDGKEAEVKQAAQKTETNDDDKDTKIDDLMETLKKSGLGGKVFSAKDFEGLSPEEMSAKFSGQPNAKKSKKASTRKPDMKATKVDDGEQIEL